MLIQVQLADLPLDADIANPQGKPLGTREQVAARFTDLLPGTQFDGEGRGAFQRGSYQIAFKLSGDPPNAVGVAFEQPDGFTAIKRIVEKTGWCLIDPVSKGFVDVDASRAAGRIVLVGDAAAAPTDAAPSSSLKLPSIAIPRISMSVAAGVVIGVLAMLAAWQFVKEKLPVHLSAAMLASQRSATTGLEKYTDRVRRRESAMKALSPDYRANRVVEQLIDFQMAVRAYWNSVGDGRFSSPDLLSSQSVWSRYQMQPFLPPSFAQKARDGYEFEFNGDGCEEPDPGWPECKGFAYVARPKTGQGPAFALFSADDRIHVRPDGATPRPADPVIQ